MIVGIDEVGRGCWAGPLVAGAVLLSEPIEGLKDSKKLTKKARDRLDALIKSQAVAYGIGWVEPAELDEVGLTQAVRLAMERALKAIEVKYDQVIIDGNFNFLDHIAKTSTLIRADDLIPAVSAASIIAKVARDNYMELMAVTYPDYGFEKHVGYGTLLHRQALSKLGTTNIHRKSFKPVKALLQ